MSKEETGEQERFQEQDFPQSIYFTMPKEIKEIKEFLLIARREDTKALRLTKKAGSQQQKFKLRCSKYLYTLVVSDAQKAEKLLASLPPSLLPKTKGKK